MTAVAEFFAGSLGRWLVVAVLALALWGHGYVTGLRHEADRHAEFVGQVAAAGATQNARTAATKRVQQSITQQTEAGYAQGSDALRGLYGPGRAGRVRQPATHPRSGELPAVPIPAAQPDAAAADLGPGPETPAAGQDACAALRSDAALTTLNLLWFQDWAERQRAASQALAP